MIPDVRFLCIPLLTFIFGGLGLVPAADVAGRKPNIVVIFTDDWGHGDVGAHGVLDDIKTPHLDRLAKEGALFTDGYVTSPQCAPSRAGLITGRYQQRFDFDFIGLGPMPLGETTIAQRLQKADYVTGMVGKWHLEPTAPDVRWASKVHPELIENGRIVSLPYEAIAPYLPGERGFLEFYWGFHSPYFTNFDREGRDLPEEGKWEATEDYRITVKTEAALAFIERNETKPFFLYLAYASPHVPLEAPQEYLDRFPGEMPERRRYALAMMSAVDDGIGEVVAALEAKGLTEDTLIVFASDNGAPLGTQLGERFGDVMPLETKTAHWDGSRNDPLSGEKGMLAEGGIRVPFVMTWPGTISPGQEIESPVISLDIAATANAIAGLPDDPKLDGINLLPYLTDGAEKAPSRDLFWRFWAQAAVRSGDWKLIEIEGKSLLFDLARDAEEQHNLAELNPGKVAELREKLEVWAGEMQPPGVPDRDANGQEDIWYDHYFQVDRK